MIVLLVGISHAPRVARVARGVALGLVSRDFVASAEALGESRARVVARRGAAEHERPAARRGGAAADLLHRHGRRPRVPRVLDRPGRRGLGRDDQREPAGAAGRAVGRAGPRHRHRHLHHRDEPDGRRHHPARREVEGSDDDRGPGRSAAADAAPGCSVEDLRVTLTDRARHRRRRRHRPRPRSGRGGRAGRRVRLGQDDRRHGDPRILPGGRVHRAGPGDARRTRRPRPSAGARSVQLRGEEIAYVPQDPASALNPSIRIGRQLVELFELRGIGTAAGARRAGPCRARRGRPAQRRRVPAPLPAPAVRRPGAAGGAGDGVPAPAQGAGAGRADDRARRHHPGHGARDDGPALPLRTRSRRCTSPTTSRSSPTSPTGSR